MPPLEPTTVFGRLARAVLTHPRVAQLCMLILSVLSILSASTLHVDSDLLNIMPKDEPSIQALKQLDLDIPVGVGSDMIPPSITGYEFDVPYQASYPSIFSFLTKKNVKTVDNCSLLKRM